MSFKPGRNDPCPCGSGQKYKKCCLAKDEETARETARTAADEVPADEAPLFDGSAYALVKIMADPSPGVLRELSGAERRRLAQRWSPAKLAKLTDTDLLGRLQRLGVHTSREAFLAVAATGWSAWSVGEEWLEHLPVELNGMDEDFVCLAACELWKRHCPDRPSIEMLDDQIDAGRRLWDDEGDAPRAAKVWLAVWDVLRLRFTTDMRRCDDTRPVFLGGEDLYDWTQSLRDTLFEVAHGDRSCVETGFRYVHEVLQQFTAEDDPYIAAFRGVLGELHFLSGQPEAGEAVFRQIIAEFPKCAAGYVGWSDVLADELSGAKPDLDRAIALLEQALAVPVEDAEDWVILERLEDLRQERQLRLAAAEE